MFPSWKRGSNNTDESHQEIRDGSQPTTAASEEEGSVTGGNEDSTDASELTEIPGAGEETP